MCYLIGGLVTTFDGVAYVASDCFANGTLFNFLDTLKMTTNNHTIPPSMLYKDIDKMPNCKSTILVPFPDKDVSPIRPKRVHVC